MVSSRIVNTTTIDILINNAGYGLVSSVEEVTEEQMLAQFNVNLFGALRLIQATIPKMRIQKEGIIINISSVAALRAEPKAMLAYSVSKAGVIMLTQALALELGHANIQVNAIAPGVIKTRFSRVLWSTPQIAEPMLDKLPLGRFGEPEEVASLALYLASPASDYVTGGVFLIDGGMNVTLAMG